ncbi:MAG: hypothetical protein NTX51_11805 [Verrucomicrobia bacterium]|nr:hypothetical protein [Verrucomicrobiota bacterium]
MKTKCRRKLMYLTALLALAAGALNLHAQGTAFTYQGRLNDAGSPAAGIYDLRFAIYDAASGGAQQGGWLTSSATAVSNGLFTVALDFGPGVFTGAGRWLEIGVRTNGSGTFATLTPRQPIMPAPYAMYSANAGSAAAASTAGSVPAAGIGAGTANISITGSALIASYASMASSAYTADTATNLVGKVSDAQLPANAARLAGTNLFTGTNAFTGILIATNPANRIAGAFTGNGTGLTNISALTAVNATNLIGSVTDAQLPANAARLAGTNVFTATNVFTGILIATNPANQFGTIADAQLPATAARLAGTNLFTGTNAFTGIVIATNPANRIAGTFTGNGTGLTNLNAVALAAGSITADKLAPGAVTYLGAPDGSPTNALQVGPNGLVGIGTAAPAAGLQITSGAAITTATVLFQVQDGAGAYTNLAGASMAAVSGNLLAVSSYTDGAVTLVDIGNPSSPVLSAQIWDGTGAFTNLAGASGLAWTGPNLVVAAAGDNAVTIISAANPASPVKLAALRDGVNGWNDLNGARAVAISGNLLAIGAVTDSAVTLADISNPAAPVLRGLIKDGFNGFTNLAGA